MSSLCYWVLLSVKTVIMKKILFILLLLQVTVVQAQKEILVSGDVSNLFTMEGIPNAKAQIILKDSHVVWIHAGQSLAL